MKNLRGFSLTAALGLAGLQMACGSQKPDSGSDLMWQQSRQGDQRYAYLETRDLRDEFVFGMQIINTNKFLASALNFNYPSQVAKIVLQGGKAYVVPTAQDATGYLLKFDARQDGQKLEVDFASPGNDVSLQQAVNQIGGIFTRGESNTRRNWRSEGAPEVVNIKQTNDKVVVDVKYLVSASTLGEDGETVTGNGSVTLRLFLARRSALTTQATAKTVGKARKDNFGYFPVGISRSDDSASPIRKFAYNEGDKITFYLKDFPADWQGVATKALKRWNDAFEGKDVVDVKVAGADVDVGEPGYNVIKWVKNGDDQINWAGTAGPSFDDPVTGTMISASAYINGDYLLDNYRVNDDFSRASDGVIKLAIGNATFTPTNGEAPVIPYATNPEVSFEEYMKGYYGETITHEAGHLFGLRHNFKGSNAAPRAELSHSIMDYLPRTERSLGAGIGRYDKEAIKYGYLTKDTFAGQYGFCTDEDLAKQWDCLQSDVGEPVAYIEAALTDGMNALAITPKEFPRHGASSIVSSVKNAVKILALKSQVPSNRQQDVVKALSAALNKICDAAPAASLDAEGRKAAAANIAAVRDTSRKALADDDNFKPVRQAYGVLKCL